jgi:transcriptional regulator GlxA family with amidase domain
MVGSPGCWRAFGELLAADYASSERMSFHQVVVDAYAAQHPGDGASPLLPEVLVHPGGVGTRPMLRDVEHLDWVRKQRATVPLLTSVCTGSLVYAAAGLLAGRPATTHWASLELLKELEPTVDLRPDDRYVDDGDLITSSGVSAGIDMALHLVARLASVERAREVRRYIQYDPEPPV